MGVSGLVDLEPLRCLEFVGGFVDIRENPDLFALDGLDRLESVGVYFHLNANPSLGDVSAMSSLQTVGDFLVIAMVVTPGATAYLLTDRFPRLILISVAIGALTSFFGAYFSYFLDGATGGIIIVLQTLLFLAAFVFAPKHGLLAARRRGAEPAEAGR